MPKPSNFVFKFLKTKKRNLGDINVPNSKYPKVNSSTSSLSLLFPVCPVWMVISPSTQTKPKPLDHFQLSCSPPEGAVPGSLGTKEVLTFFPWFSATSNLSCHIPPLTPKLPQILTLWLSMQGLLGWHWNSFQLTSHSSLLPAPCPPTAPVSLLSLSFNQN